jgi:4-hydroxy-4-methyl-2-oxoglutarate aldolase
MNAKSLAERFGEVYTGAITGVLDRRGYLQQTLTSDIAPLRPGMGLAGPAFPIEGRPHPEHNYDASIRKILDMLGAVPPGYVAVYRTNDTSSAHLGELSVTSLMSRGCAGAVIDGGCRDIEFILRENFRVFARYTNPQDCVPRWELIAHGNITVVIGEVPIAPGDWVIANDDGVVVVPRAELEVVLEETEAKVTTENHINGSPGRHAPSRSI